MPCCISPLLSLFSFSFFLQFFFPPYGCCWYERLSPRWRMPTINRTAWPQTIKGWQTFPLPILNFPLPSPISPSLALSLCQTCTFKAPTFPNPPSPPPSPSFFFWEHLSFTHRLHIFHAWRSPCVAGVQAWEEWTRVRTSAWTLNECDAHWNIDRAVQSITHIRCSSWREKHTLRGNRGTESIITYISESDGFFPKHTPD